MFTMNKKRLIFLSELVPQNTKKKYISVIFITQIMLLENKIVEFEIFKFYIRVIFYLFSIFYIS